MTKYGIDRGVEDLKREGNNLLKHGYSIEEIKAEIEKSPFYPYLLEEVIRDLNLQGVNQMLTVLKASKGKEGGILISSALSGQRCYRGMLRRLIVSKEIEVLGETVEIQRVALFLTLKGYLAMEYIEKVAQDRKEAMIRAIESKFAGLGL